MVCADGMKCRENSVRKGSGYQGTITTSIAYFARRSGLRLAIGR
jgi:hypothetical protein